MTDAPAFAGFLPQVAEYLGPAQWTEEPTAHKIVVRTAEMVLRAGPQL
jgi:hypothetical protein